MDNKSKIETKREAIQVVSVPNQSYNRNEMQISSNVKQGITSTMAKQQPQKPVISISLVKSDKILQLPLNISKPEQNNVSVRTTLGTTTVATTKSEELANIIMKDVNENCIKKSTLPRPIKPQDKNKSKLLPPVNVSVKPGISIRNVAHNQKIATTHLDSKKHFSSKTLDGTVGPSKQNLTRINAMSFKPTYAEKTPQTTISNTLVCKTSDYNHLIDTNKSQKELLMPVNEKKSSDINPATSSISVTPSTSFATTEIHPTRLTDVIYSTNFSKDVISSKSSDDGLQPEANSLDNITQNSIDNIDTVLEKTNICSSQRSNSDVSQSNIPVYTPKKKGQKKNTEQIVKCKVSDETKKRLSREQKVKQKYDFIENQEIRKILIDFDTRLQTVENNTKANLNMTSDVFSLQKSMAKTSIGHSHHDFKKIPVEFPLVSIQDMNKLEEFISESKENYDIFVSKIRSFKFNKNHKHIDLEDVVKYIIDDNFVRTHLLWDREQNDGRITVSHYAIFTAFKEAYNTDMIQVGNIMISAFTAARDRVRSADRRKQKRLAESTNSI